MEFNSGILYTPKLLGFLVIFVFNWLLNINILHYLLIHAQRSLFLRVILQTNFPWFLQKLQFLPNQGLILVYFTPQNCLFFWNFCILLTSNHQYLALSFDSCPKKNIFKSDIANWFSSFFVKIAIFAYGEVTFGIFWANQEFNMKLFCFLRCNLHTWNNNSDNSHIEFPTWSP